jgi:hypothetical protein
VCVRAFVSVSDYLDASQGPWKLVLDAWLARPETRIGQSLYMHIHPYLSPNPNPSARQ